MQVAVEMKYECIRHVAIAPVWLQSFWLKSALPGKPEICQAWPEIFGGDAYQMGRRPW